MVKQIRENGNYELWRIYGICLETNYFRIRINGL